VRKRNYKNVTIWVSVPLGLVARLGNHTYVILTRELAPTQGMWLAFPMDPTCPNLADMPWWTYVERTARGDTQAKVADRIGVTSPSVGRWAKGSLPDPSTAADFARAYGRPVLEAFVAAGFLTAEEAKQRPSQRHSIATYNDDELLAEVRRRMERGEPDDAPASQKSADEAEGDGGVNVKRLRSRRRMLTQQHQPAPGRPLS